MRINRSSNAASRLDCFSEGFFWKFQFIFNDIGFKSPLKILCIRLYILADKHRTPSFQPAHWRWSASNPAPAADWIWMRVWQNHGPPPWSAIRQAAGPFKYRFVHKCKTPHAGWHTVHRMDSSQDCEGLCQLQVGQRQNFAGGKIKVPILHFIVGLL